MSEASKGRMSGDQRLIVVLLAVMLVLIVGVSIFAPPQDVDSDVPSSTSNAPMGVKGAYLTLQGLGHSVSRWSKPLDGWNNGMTDEQAARTTLVLLDPEFDAVTEQTLKTQIARFLDRGGRVLATGPGGARLLGAKTGIPNILEGLCSTTPQGTSALAEAGSVSMNDNGGWAADNHFKGDNLQTAQTCGKDAVVVSFTQRVTERQGTAKRGVAVWWTSALPMTNAELKRNAPLKLVLASIGDGRDVVFDEGLHSITRTQWDVTGGLPIGWVAAQAAVLFALLVLSYSRRRGPVRMPVAVPRSSPVEFAHSMGDLYEKAGATSAATEAAKRRLLRTLVREGGIAPETVKAGPEAVAAALGKLLGPAGGVLPAEIEEHLEQANEAMHVQLSTRSALTLVRALSEDGKKLREAIAPAERTTVVRELALAGTKETQ